MTTSSFTSAYRGPAGVINIVAPYNRLGGEALKVGSFFGVATRDVTSGDMVPAIPEGLFILPKNAVATAMAQGVKLYWDDTNKRLDTLPVGLFVGVAETAAGATDTTVRAYIDPCPVLVPQVAVADVATADATDLASAEALANALKVKVNALLASLRLSGSIVP